MENVVLITVQKFSNFNLISAKISFESFINKPIVKPGTCGDTPSIGGSSVPEICVVHSCQSVST